MVKRLSPLRLLVLKLLDYRMSELTRLVCVRVWTTFHLRPLCVNQVDVDQSYHDVYFYTFLR